MSVNGKISTFLLHAITSEVLIKVRKMPHAAYFHITKTGAQILLYLPQLYNV